VIGAFASFIVGQIFDERYFLFEFRIFVLWILNRRLLLRIGTENPSETDDVVEVSPISLAHRIRRLDFVGPMH
jgi:hypothetical protein